MKINCVRCKLLCPSTEFTAKAKRLGYGWCKDCRKARSVAVKTKNNRQQKIMMPRASAVEVRQVEVTMTAKEISIAKSVRRKHQSKTGRIYSAARVNAVLDNNDYGSIERLGKANVHGFRK